MNHENGLEDLDCTLKDLLKSEDSTLEEKPFAGITVPLGGDSWQILPVIAGGRSS